MTSPTEEALKPPIWLLPLFLLALLALVGLTSWQWRDGAPVTADLLQLLPSGAPDALEQLAEQRMQEPLNRDLTLLVRHPDEQHADALAAELGEQLSASGLFAEVQRSLQADLPAVRRQLIDQRLALLGVAAREVLVSAPERLIDERLQRLHAPFAGPSLVPADQDWFGIADLAQRQLPQIGNVMARPDGSLLAERAGERWRVIRAQTHGDAFDDSLPQQVDELIAGARQLMESEGGELLATGGLLHAAHGQRQSRNEAAMIGTVSLLAILALLFLLFRTPQMLLVTLPLIVGALSGAAACVALFGQIHVLTLILGASLIGVSIDYPLHYLSKSWAMHPWHSTRALRLTLPGLALALTTNAIGYLALSFTPFPVLTQVAVFSTAGLLGAFACATCLLPPLLKARLRPCSMPLAWATNWLAIIASLRRRISTPELLAACLLFCLGGISQVDYNDDVYQWINRDPALQEQAERIGAITGYQPTGQYFLVHAADADELLTTQQALSERLESLVAQGQLSGYLSLSQLSSASTVQQSLGMALPHLLEASRPLQALWITELQLEAELDALQAQLPVPLDDVLDGPLAQPWRALWLGHQADGTVAGLVTLQGLRSSSVLTELDAGLEGVRLIDRRAELNQLFADTQRETTVLKLAAAGLIFAVLCLPFGWRGAMRCLSVSLLAALGSLACLGWLGQPLTLFGLFGLLLVTAIGVDYAILMREQVGGAAVSLMGTLLAAMTTWLSFGLLTLSSTPAVSNFGLTVGLGLVFAFVLAPWAAECSRDETY
jgi:predicted exporter